MNDYEEFKDYLYFRRDPDIKSIIDDKEEQLLFSDKVLKIIALGYNKERNIIVTNKAFYNLELKSKIII